MNRQTAHTPTHPHLSPEVTLLGKWGILLTGKLSHMQAEISLFADRQMWWRGWKTNLLVFKLI